MSPTGDIVAAPQRGSSSATGAASTGATTSSARGRCGGGSPARSRYKDWRAPMWEPGRWTPLFFWDEAVALAAGHRPCALCRHDDFVRWTDAWEVGPRRAAAGRPDGQAPARRTGRRAGQAHAHPVVGRACRSGPSPSSTAHPALVLERPRSCRGRRPPIAYGRPRPRPAQGTATVLTPPATVAVLAAATAGRPPVGRARAPGRWIRGATAPVGRPAPRTPARPDSTTTSPRRARTSG